MDNPTDSDYSHRENFEDHQIAYHNDSNYDTLYDYDVYRVQKDLFYLSSIFLAGAIVRHATDVLYIPIPYTVVVFFCGVIVGYLPISEIIHLGPHAILYVFMPILIFEGAFAIDVYIFKQIFLQVLILAGPALVVMVFITAGMSIYLFKYPTWDWIIALLFGSILTATDPVAVVAIMKELGTSKRLALLIEGESMLNDGTAMVCYEIFVHMSEKPDMSVNSAVLYVVWISIGGPLFGYLMAKVAIFWLQWTFNDTLTEIAITLSVAYLVFYIADAYLKVSAVLGVVALGVTLSEHRTSISPEVEMFLHSFWETLAFMANTLIFHICGFIISRFVIINAQFQDCIYLIILYFGLQVIRGLTIFLFSPVLQRLGYGLSWQDGLICTWSGLRGAIGLALSLIIFRSHIPKLNTAEVGGKILFHVSAIVVLTLLINATTMSKLITYLGVTDVTPTRRNAMTKAIKILDEHRIKSMNVWKIDRFLADAEWDMVNRICTLEDPFTISETTEEKEMRDRLAGVLCPNCHIIVPYVPTQSEVHNMLAEATRKYLKLLKQNFWVQFEKGLLTGYSVRKLIEMAEEAGDKDCEMIPVKEIKGMWRMPPKLLLVKHLFSPNCVIYPEGKGHKGSIFLMALSLLSESRQLLFVIYGTDSLIVLLSALLVVAKDFYNPGMHLKVGIQNTSMLLCLFSTGYFIFRVIMFQIIYLKTVWFYLNLICLFSTYIEFFYIIFNLMSWYQYFSYDLDMFSYSDTSYTANLILGIRLLRVLQLCEFGSYVILDMVVQNIRGRLTSGCDMARGFVRANEVAMRLVDNISDDPFVQSKLKLKAELAMMNVLRELGLLQGLYPDVALGVKTSQAIRSVLNVLREGMHHLIEEGGIDEPEGMLFVKVIEAKMQRVMANPPRLLIPSPRKILEAVAWIDGNSYVVDVILRLAERRLYQFGETIMRIGEPPDGIHIIISGLVKVEVPLDTAKPESATQPVRLLDFLSTGNVVGERSVLMDQARSATLTCETIVETMFLSIPNLQVVFESFAFLDPPLKARMWKVCAIKVAVNILTNMPSYRGMRQDTLLRRLDNAELAYLDATNTFIVNTNVVDTILIAGRGKDVQKNDTYVGPCYIPKHVQELKFSPDQRPTPLVLYTEKQIGTNLPGGRLSLCFTERSKSMFNIDYAGPSGLDTLNF